MSKYNLQLTDKDIKKLVVENKCHFILLRFSISCAIIATHCRYTFSDENNNDYQILLDSEYTDTVLRFLTPVGFLENPVNNYIKEVQYFSLNVDFEVESVALWHDIDTTTSIKIADFIRSEEHSNIFELVEWKILAYDPSYVSGDTINLRFELTDIFGQTGSIQKTFTIDFNPPTGQITVGTTGQNFEENNDIAGPLTPISFSYSDDLSTACEEYYRIID